MSSMEVNRADVLAEVSRLCAAYDRALKTNDVAALVEFFWDDECAMRLGVTEELYGAEAISAFRKARVVNFQDRRNLRETVVTFGDSLAIATVEFTATVDAAPRHGRQSQIWVRFPDAGWKIVSAHISHRVIPADAATAYVPAAATLLDMHMDPAYREGVTHDLAVMARLFEPLMALDLSGTEAAPVFTA
jgi:ketosteroid isomerase-like protein